MHAVRTVHVSQEQALPEGWRETQRVGISLIRSSISGACWLLPRSLVLALRGLSLMRPCLALSRSALTFNVMG